MMACSLHVFVEVEILPTWCETLPSHWLISAFQSCPGVIHRPALRPEEPLPYKPHQPPSLPGQQPHQRCLVPPCSPRGCQVHETVRPQLQLKYIHDMHFIQLNSFVIEISRDWLITELCETLRTWRLVPACTWPACLLGLALGMPGFICGKTKTEISCNPACRLFVLISWSSFEICLII